MLKKARKGGDRNQGGERQGDRWQNTSLHCGVEAVKNRKAKLVEGLGDWRDTLAPRRLNRVVQ